jgi:uncharacterized protein YbbK (DUF523 family)
MEISTAALRIPTAEQPLRILMSGCLALDPCGYDGSTNGNYPPTAQLLHQPLAKIIPFCPEAFSFGVPREMCDIHGGTGHDVWMGRARVLTASGVDWTEGMKAGAEAMLATAQRERAEVCILMDISAACGSSVVYGGNRLGAEHPGYRAGMGVATALLRKHGFLVISQRDFASLEPVFERVLPNYKPLPEAIDHRDTPWYRSYFGLH